MKKFFDHEITGKTTQSMTALLGNLGESSVLLILSYLVHGRNWEASKVISEGGYDLLLSKKNGKKRIRFEVKTRQTILSIQQPIRNYVAFDLSINEWNSCDILIGYWWDEAAFYIVPKKKLKPTKKNKGGPVTLYRYEAKRKKPGILLSDSHLNNWRLIKDALK